MAPTVATATPQIQAGKLLPLVLFSPKRVPELPNVPTASELGLTGFDDLGWMGIAAKAGTPPETIRRTARCLAEIPDRQSRASEDEDDASHPDAGAVEPADATDRTRYRPSVGCDVRRGFQGELTMSTRGVVVCPQPEAAESGGGDPESRR